MPAKMDRVKFNIILFLVVSTGIDFKVLATGWSEVAQAFYTCEVVPDVVLTPPDCDIQVCFHSGAEVKLGNILTPTEVQDEPTVSWNADPHKYYVLVMTNPDVPCREDPKDGEFQHWLVVNIPGSNVAEGETLSEYIGSLAPPGTGLHRYVFLVYEQPWRIFFDEPRLSNRSLDHRHKFSIAKFAAKHNLGHPVAGNFFQAEYDECVATSYALLEAEMPLQYITESFHTLYIPELYSGIHIPEIYSAKHGHELYHVKHGYELHHGKHGYELHHVKHGHELHHGKHGCHLHHLKHGYELHHGKHGYELHHVKHGHELHHGKHGCHLHHLKHGYEIHYGKHGYELHHVKHGHELHHGKHGCHLHHLKHGHELHHVKHGHELHYPKHGHELHHIKHGHLLHYPKHGHEKYGLDKHHHGHAISEVYIHKEDDHIDIPTLDIPIDVTTLDETL